MGEDSREQRDRNTLSTACFPAYTSGCVRSRPRSRHGCRSASQAHSCLHGARRGEPSCSMAKGTRTRTGRTGRAPALHQHGPHAFTAKPSRQGQVSLSPRCSAEDEEPGGVSARQASAGGAQQVHPSVLDGNARAGQGSLLPSSPRALLSILFQLSHAWCARSCGQLGRALHGPAQPAGRWWPRD